MKAGKASSDAQDSEPVCSRPVAPGGWQRGVIGVLVGLAAGALAALLAPRERIGARHRH